jgi:hypothetical protein
MRQPDRDADHQGDGAGHMPESAQIIPFKRRAGSGAPKRLSSDGSLQQSAVEEDRLRMRQNIAAAVVLIALLAAGSWLIANLRTSVRIEMCVEAGHANCSPLQPTSR